MKETNTTDSQVRQEYEPMEVKVMTVTPQGVLCGSGGGSSFKSSVSISCYGQGAM